MRGGRRISISRCLERAFLSRLVTQMYFPGDPLQLLDPIFNSIPDERARNRLISRFDMEPNGA